MFAGTLIRVLLCVVFASTLVAGLEFMSPPKVAEAAVQQSFTTGDDWTFELTGENLLWRAQVFSTESGYTVSGVRVKLTRSQNYSGTITASIQGTQQNFGDVPTGINLCSGTLDSTFITTSTTGNWYLFKLMDAGGDAVNLAATTHYAVVLKATNDEDGGTVGWRLEGDQGYADNFIWTGLLDDNDYPTSAGTDTNGFMFEVRDNVSEPDAPVVSAISPTSGTRKGGTTVNISGINFTGATGVKFGANDAAGFILNSDTSITAFSPAGIEGIVDITVNTPGGISAFSSSDQFEYQYLTYTVTYDGNGSTGGIVPVDDSLYEPGDPVTISGDTDSLQRSGYVFSNWNTAPDGSGRTYYPGATYNMESQDIVLYAMWDYVTTVKLVGTKSVKSGNTIHLTALVDVAADKSYTPPGVVYFLMFTSLDEPDYNMLGDAEVEHGIAMLNITDPILAGTYYIIAYYIPGDIGYSWSYNTDEFILSIR